jgi:hypothetical protein
LILGVSICSGKTQGFLVLLAWASFHEGYLRQALCSFFTNLGAKVEDSLLDTQTGRFPRGLV